MSSLIATTREMITANSEIIKAIGLDSAAAKAMADAESLTQNATLGMLQQSLSARMEESALITQKLSDGKPQLSDVQKQQFVAAADAILRAFERVRPF